MIDELIGKSGVFVTATGTDVGKTYVSAILLKQLREGGVNAGYYKPALSGAYMCEGKLTAGDADYVCRTAKIDQNPSELVGYTFEQATSPHLAARLSNTKIDESAIMEKYHLLKSRYDFLVVEGAGGISCPLRVEEGTLLLIDIINMMQLEVVIVAPSGLGAINSTLLTIEYAKAHGAKILGVIMNMYDEKNLIHRDNKASIEELSGARVIAEIPFEKRLFL